MTERFSKKGFRGAGRMAAIGLGIAVALAMPLSVSARGRGNHGGGYYGGGNHGGYYGGNHGGYGRHDGNRYSNRSRGHWNNGGRWIAGAIVTGAVIGLVNDALRPAPVYYGRPVVYSQPRTVIYTDDYPVVTQRVVERRTVIYNNQSDTRYVRDDGYDSDESDQGYDD